MNDARIPETLRRIIDAVIREAAENPAFAQRLAQAIGDDLASAAKAARKPAPRKPFDASQFHAVNILRQHGEAALRGKLEEVRAVEDLKSVARSSGLVLSGNAGRPRPSRTELILGIVEAAKHYDAQRSAATA
jgi:hypothetical protein